MQELPRLPTRDDERFLVVVYVTVAATYAYALYVASHRHIVAHMMCVLVPTMLMVLLAHVYVCAVLLLSPCRWSVAWWSGMSMCASASTCAPLLVMFAHRSDFLCGALTVSCLQICTGLVGTIHPEPACVHVSRVVEDGTLFSVVQTVAAFTLLLHRL